ncbi:GNAT family N-acetyltransferase [Methylobacterium sp. sgz302541]|uniref:GNAT family N-acetyltransferase n=1 Tax=unclassified Methylobacterium TaxID=2615210 RepID=UPI003D33AB46
MSVGVTGVSGMVGAGTRAADRASAEILPDLAAAEALWRGLDAAPGRLGTPYQRFDWVSAYARSGAADGAIRVAVVRDAGGQPRLLLPLEIARARGLTVARGCGATHANFHLPLFASREAAAIGAEDLVHALVLAGRAAGIDVYDLAQQPRSWEGAINPLALRGEPAASDAYGMMLGPDADATLKRAFSADARKKLRSKEKRLTEALGPLAYRRAGTPEEARAILAAFHEQKAARFAAMGIADPYAPPPIRDFLARAAEGADPTIELHALVSQESGRVLATFIGAVDATRYSGMATSYDPSPEVSRYSPGDLLLHHLVREQTERGRRALDLGVGEARYKASVCDETIELVDIVIPVTLRGRLYGLVATARTRLKRRIKRSTRCYALVVKLRRMARR